MRIYGIVRTMFNGRSIKTTGNLRRRSRKKRSPRSFSFLCAYRPVIRKTWYYPMITSRRRCLVTSSAVLITAVFSLSQWFSINYYTPYPTHSLIFRVVTDGGWRWRGTGNSGHRWDTDVEMREMRRGRCREGCG